MLLILRIVGLTMPENRASMRVLEKVGMVRREPISYEGEPAELFVLEAKDFLPIRPSDASYG